MRRSTVRMLLAWVFTAGAAELAAQNAPAGPSFLIFRYASESALAMYSGYDTGPVLLVVGMLHNPRSAYREVMGGVARAFGVPGGSFTVAAAGAYTNTGWYAQLYGLPAVQAGPARLEATIQFAEPLDADGVRAVYVSPGNAFVAIGRGLSLGAGYYGSFEAGFPAAHGLGPALRLAVPKGSVTLELVAGVRHAKDEVRLTLRSTF